MEADVLPGMVFYDSCRLMKACKASFPGCITAVCNDMLITLRVSHTRGESCSPCLMHGHLKFIVNVKG